MPATATSHDHKSRFVVAVALLYVLHRVDRDCQATRSGLDDGFPASPVAVGFQARIMEHYLLSTLRA